MKIVIIITCTLVRYHSTRTYKLL